MVDEPKGAKANPLLRVSAAVRATPLSANPLTRSASRLTQAAVLLRRTSAAATREFGRGLPRLDGNEPAETAHKRARLLSELARGMCRSHGIVPNPTAELDGPAVYVANHLSYVDPVTLMSIAPMTAIAKGEVQNWPLLGPLMTRLGVIWVRRGDPYSGARVLLRARRLLQAGVSVLVFPEGTTSNGDEVLPMRRGIFGIAQQLDVPVIPIALRYADRRICWVGNTGFLPHYLKVTGRHESLAHIQVGTPMEPQPSSRAQDLAARARTIIFDMLRGETHAAKLASPLHPSRPISLLSSSAPERRRAG